jgi:hypothetical protein
MSDTLSTLLVQQRVRNRISEYFDLASSLEDIARFGAFEVINMWEDWVADPKSDFFAEPVFSQLEQAAIRRFHAVWDHCADQTSEDIFDAQTLRELECWRGFRDAASSALKLFEHRGRFSEDEEAF